MPHLCGTAGPRKYMCGCCGEDCLYDGVFCDGCETWRHIACERIGVKELQTFKELPPDFPYICVACRTDSRGSFSFDESIKRLNKAAKQGYEKLESSVIRESLFIKNKLSASRTKAADPKVDTQAQALIENYIHNLKTSSAPVRITGDGNSLFSAVSVALTGKDKLSTELRVRCCIEMVTFSAFYQWQQNHETLRLYAPDYVDSCLNCATPNEESCVWTMSALTSVIGTPIKSIYPAVNGQEDRAISALNTQFSPRVVKEDQKQEDAIKILWSTKKPAKTPVPPGTWVPDHFVPLVEVRSIQLSPVMTSLHPSRVSGRKRKPTAKLLETIKSESGNTSLHMEVTVDDEDAPESDISGLDLEGQSPSKTKRRKKMIMVDETMDFDWQRKYTHDAVGGKPITGSGFMPIKDVFQVLTKAKDPLPSIPRGRKNDVYFVVDNSRNTRHPTRRNYFSDDCGLYKQRCGTTCKNWYLYKDGTICALNKVGGKYCKETKLVTKTVQGKPVKEVTWIPMDPQPEASSLILLHRYYAMLQCDPYYRRRISWFSVLPPSVEGGKDIMLVEYLNKPRAGRSRAVSSGPIHDTDSEDAETSIAEEGAKKNSLAAQAEEMEKGGESGTQPSKTTSAENSVDKHYSKETPTEKTDTNEEADKAESNEKEVDKIVSTEKDDDKPESAEKESDTTESAEKESDKTESPEKETSKVQIRKTTRSRK